MSSSSRAGRRNAGRGAIPGTAIFVTALSAFAAAKDTLRVSVDSAGKQANRESTIDVTSTSGDGQVVAFTSYASNLVTGDTNGKSDIFVHERTTGATERVSVDSSGVQGNDNCYAPCISADGNTVAFNSYSSNLVPGDANGSYDVFVHDRSTGATERVSVDSSGKEGNTFSVFPSISADGQIVAFESDATNLVPGDTNNHSDVFVHDRSTGVTERVSVDSNGTQGNGSSYGPAISADGRIVAFPSESSNLVAGDANGLIDVFVHDRSTGITVRVSVDSSGTEGDGDSYGASISRDGQIVAFMSDSSNLVAGDTNAAFDVFVHDRGTGLTERVSVDSSGVEGNDRSSVPGLSSDGTMVAFWSLASNLVAGDTNRIPDAFVHDRQSGVTERVSVDSKGAEGNGSSVAPSISADGLAVAFSSDSTNFVRHDTNRWTDVFVHELCSTPASWSNYGAGFPGTNGVPTLTARANPVLGATLTLDLSNSYAIATAGLLFVGFTQTSIHSSWGGDLLVLPVLTIPIGIPSSGVTFTGSLPHDDRLCGTSFDLQAIEADPGAAKGVSFTQGLELLLGH